MSSEHSLAGKVALVTGGGRGIGRAIAARLARAGAGVAIASRKIEVLERTAQELAPLPGRVHPIACHVGRREDLERAVRETESALGPIDILVNNSATNVQNGAALEATDEQLDKMIGDRAVLAHLHPWSEWVARTEELHRGALAESQLAHE